MPELRKDPIIGRWVIISTERGKRPSDFVIEPEKKKGGFCPFCAGNEDKTPPEVLAYRKPGTAPNTPGWWVRVVSNKYPALRVEGDLHRRGEGIFDLMNGVGAHEVIIETPEHDKDLVDLPVEHIMDVLWAYHDRIVDLKRDDRLKYILIFKNHGSAAGASLEHTHSQLIATPIIPKRVVEEMEGYERYYEYKERCIYCDIIRQETENRKRIVTENEAFVSWEPFAPRFPFETWILPKRHALRFEEPKKDDYLYFARILKETLQRLKKALSNPPYNFIIHNSPLQDTEEGELHWHMEIIPKLTKVAGFEWGSGFYINTTPPEDAAQFLRELDISDMH
jgi:UDPglucose--hexose-1-phosphate uridylyltransferase